MFTNHLEQFTVSDLKTTGKGLGLQFFERELQFNLPYLFICKPTSAISRDPKLLSVLIGEVFKTCKLKILGYKPRPAYSENSILKQTEMNNGKRS